MTGCRIASAADGRGGTSKKFASDIVSTLAPRTAPITNGTTLLVKRGGVAGWVMKAAV